MFRRLAKRLPEMHGQQLWGGYAGLCVRKSFGSVGLARGYVKESCRECKVCSGCCQVVRYRLYSFPHLQMGEEVTAFSDV